MEPDFDAMPNLSVQTSTEVDEVTKDRQLYTEMLITQLARAQNRMKIQADRQRHDRQFQLGE